MHESLKIAIEKFYIKCRRIGCDECHSRPCSSATSKDSPAHSCSFPPHDSAFHENILHRVDKISVSNFWFVLIFIISFSDPINFLRVWTIVLLWTNLELTWNKSNFINIMDITNCNLLKNIDFVENIEFSENIMPMMPKIEIKEEKAWASRSFWKWWSQN